MIFVFRPGRDADSVTLGSCTGWVRHMGRFSESGTYEFTLDAQLSEGDAEVTLLGAKKELLLRLNRQTPAGRINLDTENRYYLRWQCRGAPATGARRGSAAQPPTAGAATHQWMTAPLGYCDERLGGPPATAPRRSRGACG